MAISSLSRKQKAAMHKKLATGAANFMRKNFKAPTPAQKKKEKAVDAHRRVKAIIQSLPQSKRRAVIKNLQKRKKARANKK